MSKDRLINRRELLKYGVYGGLAPSLLSSLWIDGYASPGKKSKPNIIFILIDTLRADHLSAYGYNRDTTPNIGRLSEMGILFERVIAPSSWTKTSMASIMTSKEPACHRVLGINDKLPKKLQTIAKGLKKNGYQTIGVNTNPWLKSNYGFKAGFDLYYTFPKRDSYYYGTAWEVNNKAKDFLKEVNHKKPVFLYLHYMDVHAPYVPKAPYFSKPPMVIPGKGEVPNKILHASYRTAGPAVQKRVLELYDGEIKTADAAIGKLITELGEMGFMENMLLVVTADHGEEFMEHGDLQHGRTLYPEVLEVPLIFYRPGELNKGLRVSSQVRSIDIAPTLFELAALAVPESFDGTTLLPMKKGEVKNRIAISGVGLNDAIPDKDYVAAVSNEHLYILERRSGKVEFYNLRIDPKAQVNLGGEHPKTSFYAALVKGEFESVSEQTTPDKTTLDEATQAQLKSLGYLR